MEGGADKPDMIRGGGVTAGAGLRAAMAADKPLQLAGAVNASFGLRHLGITSKGKP